MIIYTRYFVQTSKARFLKPVNSSMHCIPPESKTTIDLSATCWLDATSGEKLRHSEWMASKMSSPKLWACIWGLGLSTSQSLCRSADTNQFKEPPYHPSPTPTQSSQHWLQLLSPQQHLQLFIKPSTRKEKGPVSSRFFQLHFICAELNWDERNSVPSFHIRVNAPHFAPKHLSTCKLYVTMGFSIAYRFSLQSIQTYWPTQCIYLSHLHPCHHSRS